MRHFGALRTSGVSGPDLPGPARGDEVLALSWSEGLRRSGSRGGPICQALLWKTGVPGLHRTARVDCDALCDVTILRGLPLLQGKHVSRSYLTHPRDAQWRSISSVYIYI